MSQNENLHQTEEKQAGFCSATCIDRPSLQHAIKQPPLKTSDMFATCNLPKRFEHPHWFNGYGCQMSKQNPVYRTSSSDYGWYPPVHKLAISRWYVPQLQPQHRNGSCGIPIVL
ncbi:unnamed protein product [Leptidea sinapis]|uniref:Uncharacterized protein n=1 Tax=Leptidea sinapis TaxID=189913 RepID=A0A5E4R1M5_9NEOP|nr:unnamed protein product [Leptidea sinapis]